MLNRAITFQRREDVVLGFVCVLCAANWEKKKKNQPKYRVVFQEHARVFPFHVGPRSSPTGGHGHGKEFHRKKENNKLSHCNNGHLSQWPGFL